MYMHVNLLYKKNIYICMCACVCTKLITINNIIQEA